MNTNEVLKLALEALEGIHPGNMTPMAEEYWNKAITALQEALAEQPAQQEPDLAKSYREELDKISQRNYELRMENASLKAAPTAQQEPVAAAKKDAVFSAAIEFIGTLTGMKPPPIEVAPPEILKPFRDFTEKVCSIFATPQPAQRKPLTTKEIREWWASENGLEDCAMSKLDDFEKVVRAIEAKLKEKNT